MQVGEVEVRVACAPRNVLQGCCGRFGVIRGILLDSYPEGFLKRISWKEKVAEDDKKMPRPDADISTYLPTPGHAWAI